MNSILALPKPEWVKEAENLEQTEDFDKKAWKDAQDIINNNENINDYMQMKRVVEGWDTAKEERFRAIHRHAVGQYVDPKRTAARVKRQVEESYVKDFTKEYSEQIPILRDIRYGFSESGRKNPWDVM